MTAGEFSWLSCS